MLFGEFRLANTFTISVMATSALEAPSGPAPPPQFSKTVQSEEGKRRCCRGTP